MKALEASYPATLRSSETLRISQPRKVATVPIKRFPADFIAAIYACEIPCGAMRAVARTAPHFQIIELPSRQRTRTIHNETKREPNKAMEPIPVAVTSCADAHLAPSTFMAHL